MDKINKEKIVSGVVALAIILISGFLINKWYLTTPKEAVVQSPEKIESDDNNILVDLETNYGIIKLKLFPDRAPQTVDNFTKLVSKGFYNGLTFHRVIKDFMIQGGDPNGDGTGGPGYTFPDEINDLKLIKGRLAMANSGPNTNGSQFFIVTAESTPWLDGLHTVFGEVIEGREVIEKISSAPVDEKDRPVEQVVIEKVIIK